MGPLLWTICGRFLQPIHGSISITVWLVYCLWNVVYHSDTMRPLLPSTVVCPNRRFSPTDVFSRRTFFPAGGFPGRPGPWRGRHLGTAEAVPRERLGSRPGRHPLVPIGRAAASHWPIGRAATYHWSVASVLREGTLGVQGRALGKIPIAKLWSMVYCIPQRLCTEPYLAGMAAPRNRRVQRFAEAPISIWCVAAS